MPSVSNPTGVGVTSQSRESGAIGSQPPGNILYVGPLPPPMHGQSIATGHLLAQLRKRGAAVEPVDTSPPISARPDVLAVKARALAKATRWALRLGPGDTLYISVPARVTALFYLHVCLLARLRRASIVLHHHTFSYLDSPHAAIRLLVWAGGPRAVHLALGSTMAARLQETFRHATRTEILSNAGLIDDRLVDREREPSNPFAVGHISNLSCDKGIHEVVEAYRSLLATGRSFRFVIAGPIADECARTEISRAQQDLGSRFEYVGPVGAEAKVDFFGNLDCLLFPSRLPEGAPLVLLEAIAADVPCISFRSSGAREILGDGRAGLLIDYESDYPAAAAGWVVKLMEGDLGQEAPSPRAHYRKLLASFNNGLDRTFGLEGS